MEPLDSLFPKGHLPLTKVYRARSEESIKERLDQLLSTYQKFYNDQAIDKEKMFYCRAPGRVNLIGEHIDYMGYGVLPFAIEKDTVIVGRQIEKQVISISHVDSEQYPAVEIPGGMDLISIQKALMALPSGKIEYYAYVLAGLASVLRLGSGASGGLQVVMTGDVPLGSGLSSSSSVVCAASVVAMQVTGWRGDSEQLVQSVISAERALGINCGGMDQTISLMGQLDQAMSVLFQPSLQVSQVPLSDQVAFIIANSLTQSIKSQSMHKHYNLRVLECRLALEVLCRASHIDRVAQGIQNMANLQEKLAISAQQLMELIQKELPSQPVSHSEAESLVGPLKKVVGDLNNYEGVLEHNSEFNLRDRAMHVVGEHMRVESFIRLSREQQGDYVQKIGVLMDESQYSCKHLYQCSSTNLDKIVELAKQNGALGARLTGAGWGGCAVLMVYRHQTKQVMGALHSQFYQQFQQPEMHDQWIFTCTPGQGAFGVSVSQL